MTLTRGMAKTEVDNDWWAAMPAPKEVLRREPDRNWRWAELFNELKSKKGGRYVRGWALRTAEDGLVQGVMLYRTNALSHFLGSSGERKPVVYVEYLATAPWNRSRLTKPNPARFRDVGPSLLRLAVAHSHYLGGSGLISLTSVPLPATIERYRQFGLEAVGDPDDGFVDMELPTEVATRYLREMGLQ